MAHPKRKHSHSRSRKRQGNVKVESPVLVRCSHCKNLKPAFSVCPFCGFYRGKKVWDIKEKAKEKKGGNKR